ncbi:hypothetical protein [Bradyrhizobium sp. CB2312]|uniref:hypothetical protein n=1 Tax=Bradyrhizobium sp. CB2312 TaxID=3039155 RepID=UPI0024B05DCB|nr:hypothetical protein [Bradyrhizobium sp. CB2312]WFU75088.1 hypothetical protein QA642_14215 [Bradyrhizobium sp. CB2312]
MHVLMDQHAAHGNGAVAHPLGAGDEIGRDAQSLRGKGRSQSPEACDDLVEDQRDAGRRRWAGYRSAGQQKMCSPKHCVPMGLRLTKLDLNSRVET